MTTVIYKDKTFYADSLITSGDTKLLYDNKLYFSVPLNSICVVIGETSRGNRFIDNLEKIQHRNLTVKDYDYLEDVSNVIVYNIDTNKLINYSGCGFDNLDSNQTHIFGGGRDYAMVAMYFSNDPIDAIKVTAKFHAKTGGKIYCLTTNGNLTIVGNCYV